MPACVCHGSYACSPFASLPVCNAGACAQDPSRSPARAVCAQQPMPRRHSLPAAAHHSPNVRPDAARPFIPSIPDPHIWKCCLCGYCICYICYGWIWIYGHIQHCFSLYPNFLDSFIFLNPHQNFIISFLFYFILFFYLF